MDLLIKLLEWSRSQTGTMNFNPEQIDLIFLIHQVTEISNDIASQKSISIQTHLPDKATAFADKDMLNAIFRNLISNAIKFTQQGGEIYLTVKQEKEDWKVTVSDNGVGIKKEALDRLFRIDASYKTTGTNHENGTGLGLLLWKEFIDKHGAKIWEESEVGSGSKFYFTIPNNSTILKEK